jgi:hypothetical protein
MAAEWVPMVKARSYRRGAVALAAGIPVWTPTADEFLKSQNLALRDTLLEIPSPAVEPPAYFSPGTRDAFEHYLLSPPHQAFAASQTGAFASSVAQRKTEDAQRHALEICRKSAPKNQPRMIVMIDDNKMQD